MNLIQNNVKIVNIVNIIVFKLINYGMEKIVIHLQAICLFHFINVKN